MGRWMESSQTCFIHGLRVLCRWIVIVGVDQDFGAGRDETTGGRLGGVPIGFWIMRGVRYEQLVRISLDIVNLMLSTLSG